MSDVEAYIARYGRGPRGLCEHAAGGHGSSGLIATCNIAADSSTHHGRALRACDTLAKQGRLSLAEPDAASASASAYSRYEQDLKR